MLPLDFNSFFINGPISETTEYRCDYVISNAIWVGLLLENLK